MVQIVPFRALRYAPTLVSSLSELVAPPYDVIDAAETRQLWERDPYNVVHLILPAGDLPAAQRELGYRRAGERLQGWKSQGVLVPDAQPSFYLYRQRFRLPTGEPRTRHGFFALAQLAAWGQGIYRHERTLPGPVADRIRILQACQANLSSVFGLYSDPEQEIIGALTEQVAGQAPLGEAIDDRGVWHGLWRIGETRALQRVGELLHERPVVVADGHHRYTAALEYRRRRGEDGGAAMAPWDYVLFYLGAIEDPGLTILPTHQVMHGLVSAEPERIVAQLARRFALQRQTAFAALLERMHSLSGSPDVVLGAVLRDGRCYLLWATRPPAAAAPEEALDVSILRRGAVEPLLRERGASGDLENHLRYTHEAAQAAAWVSTGQADVAFLLRPTPLEQVRSVALAGRLMPQKSTYFYPKPLSGLVIYDHAVKAGEARPLPAEAMPAS